MSNVYEEVLNLKRNDLKGAIEVARRSMQRGDWNGDAAEILIRLQDSSLEIIDELNTLEASFKKESKDGD